MNRRMRERRENSPRVKDRRVAAAMRDAGA